MTIKTKILIFLLLFSKLISYSQVNARINSMTTKSSLYVDNPYEKVEGNPYVEEEFMEGVVVFKDSSKISEVFLRLNHNTDQIEFMEGDEIRGFTKPEDLAIASFGSRSFIYNKYRRGKKIQSGYFEVLASGYCKLLFRRESIIKREQVPPSEMSGGNYRDYFRTTKEYYLVLGAEPAKKVIKSQKNVLKVLAEEESNLKKYIADEGLKVKNEKDLVKLINYYNKLKE